MSIENARQHLRSVQWSAFMQSSKAIARGAYRFRGHVGVTYGRNAVWVTNHGKPVYLQFFEGERLPYKNWELYGGWMSAEQFKQLTGIDPFTPVVKGSD